MAELIEGKYTVQSLYDTAKKHVVTKTATSKILDVEKEAEIPKFETHGKIPRCSLRISFESNSLFV